jgi:hypothetical protein
MAKRKTVEGPTCKKCINFKRLKRKNGKIPHCRHFRRDLRSDFFQKVASFCDGKYREKGVVDENNNTMA